jgi:APA family basic amino acid/polyamine antiporter
VAILLAGYVDASFVRLGPVGTRVAAALVLVTLTAINAVGIRAGKRLNNAIMAVKVAGCLAIVALAFAGGRPAASRYEIDVLLEPSGSHVALLLTALVPIMFAYGGWQTCGSIAGEIRDPARNLARANVLGVAAIVVLYVGLNLAYLRVLSPAEIAGSQAVAADMARAVAGPVGARLVSALIVVSALGFLSVIVLTAPRLYYAMARDGLFPARAGTLHPRYRTPTFTLWLQAVVSIALLASNTYDQLLSFVVFADWLFFGLTVGALFVLRRREPDAPGVARMPGHPITTLIFVAAAAGIVANSYVAYPVQSAIGTGILLLAGLGHTLVRR